MEHTRKLILQAQNGDKGAMEELVRENTGLVYSVAKKFHAAGVEFEDLVQIGFIGLLKSIERFDLKMEVKFSTYGVPMIIGEIRRFLRDDGIIKVSRVHKENQYRVLRATQQLSMRLGREPYLSEIAQETGIEAEEILIAKEATQEISSIYQTIGESEQEGYLVDCFCAEHTEILVNGNLEDEEKTKLIDRIMVQQLLEQFTEFEQKLIRLRYYENRTQCEIARELGISQVQVSRLEKKIIMEMKRKLL